MPSKKLGILPVVVIFFLVCYDIKYGQVSEVTEDNPTDKPRRSGLAEDNRNFMICSQNIWLSLIPLTGNNRAVRARLVAFANAVSSCDIVLLQELFILKLGPLLQRRNYLQLTELMREKGFVYLATSLGTVPKYLGQNSGLVIYSKQRIISSTSSFYKDRTLYETPNNKGYIITQVGVGGCIVFIANTHLDAHDRSVRERQLKELVRMLWSEVVRLPAFVVLAGDLNVLGDDDVELGEVKRIIRTLDLKEVFTEHEATHMDGGAPDHMFVSGNILVNHKEIRQIVTTSNEPVSDHRVLLASLKLDKRAWRC